MIEKIEYYLENDSQRIKIGRRGSERALKDHSLDRRADEMMNILKTKFKMA